MITIDFNATPAQQSLLPPKTIKKITAVLSTHLGFEKKQAEVTIAFVTQKAIQTLNHDFRGKNKPTNVLSFPQYTPKEIKKIKFLKNETMCLGDVIVCRPYLRKEALRLKKPLNHHLIHLVVHGVLHLLGYDHIKDADAQKMEKIETVILAELGIPDPYAHPSHTHKKHQKKQR